MAAIELNLDPDRRTLRQFGFVALGAFGLLGGLVLWRGGLLGLDFGGASPAVAAALWALGALSGALSLVAPRWNRPLWVGLALVTFPIGWLVSHAIMALLFYGMLTPIGLVFRVIGRDALHRRFDPRAESYWVAREAESSTERYLRQF